jgi:hypothetical protein
MHIASDALAAFAVNMMKIRILAYGWFAALIIHIVDFHVDCHVI